MIKRTEPRPSNNVSKKLGWNRQLRRTVNADDFRRAHVGSMFDIISILWSKINNYRCCTMTLQCRARRAPGTRSAHGSGSTGGAGGDVGPSFCGAGCGDVVTKRAFFINLAERCASSSGGISHDSTSEQESHDLIRSGLPQPGQYRSVLCARASLDLARSIRNLG